MRAGVPALVYASSVGAYAPGPTDRTVDESWPSTGITSSFYSRHKAQVERLLDAVEARSPELRSVRLRPALTFKGDAASGIRRLFMGPLLPSPLMRADWLSVIPYPRGLRTQEVHSRDVGEAYRLAATRPVAGAFNIAAEPILDAQSVGKALDARILELPVELVRAANWASWKLRVQPTSPGWLEMGMSSPLMDVTRAREELGWQPTASATEAVLELLGGLERRAGLSTPRLDPATSGRLRWRELFTGVEHATDKRGLLARRVTMSRARGFREWLRGSKCRQDATGPQPGLARTLVSPNSIQTLAQMRARGNLEREQPVGAAWRGACC